MSTTSNLRTYLDFEKPILELENKVAELKTMQQNGKGPQIACLISCAPVAPPVLAPGPTFASVLAHLQTSCGSGNALENP